MGWYWVCGKDRKTGEWVEMVRWEKLEDAKSFARNRQWDFGGSVNIKDEDTGKIVYSLLPGDGVTTK